MTDLKPGKQPDAIQKPEFSACIEWLFADESDTFAERIALAKEAGFSAIEFWRSSNKDLDAIRAELDRTGLRITCFLVEPKVSLLRTEFRNQFLGSLQKTIPIAKGLRAEFLIIDVGNIDLHCARALQRDALVSNLIEAAEMMADAGARLIIEPLNSIHDHRGCFLSSTTEALDILDEVNKPNVGIIYDIYHSAAMGEITENVLLERVHRVFHVHVADYPGRGAPGTGTLDLAHRIGWVFSNGYNGSIGLEYRPSGKSSIAAPAIIDKLTGYVCRQSSLLSH